MVLAEGLRHDVRMGGDHWTKEWCVEGVVRRVVDGRAGTEAVGQGARVAGRRPIRRLHAAVHLFSVAQPACARTG